MTNSSAWPAGKTLFNSKELMQSGPDEMGRIIREREPVRRGTRLGQAFATALNPGLA